MLALLVCAGCEPAQTTPVQTMALVLSNQGTYEPKQVTINTLSDAVAVKGSVLSLVGGARIVVDPNDPLLATNGGNLTDEQLAQVFIKARGIPPRASYVERGNVLWPADFHTWNMVTTYYNFEKAFEYFQGVGVPAAEMENATLYYFPFFALLDLSPNALVDNALFFSPVQAFMVLPFEQLQTVPLPMNFGVIAHEFSHRVFNRRVYEGRAFPEPLMQWSGGVSSPALNILKSLDEGLADWNAVGATCLSPYGCNTRFLSASLGPEETNARDMAMNDKCMTTGLRTAINGSVGDFTREGNEYRLGTVIASVLHHAAERTGQHAVLRRAVLSAYSDDTPGNPGLAQLISQNINTPYDFTLGAAANVILSHIGDGDSELNLRKEVCNGFIDQLQLPKSTMPACPLSAAGNNPALCPVLPPQ